MRFNFLMSHCRTHLLVICWKNEILLINNNSNNNNNNNNTTKVHTFQYANRLLGTFAKLRKATINFMSVRPSVRMKLCCHWTDFHEI